MIYLDHAATTKPLKNVLATYHQIASKHFANPSSPHHLGESSEDIILAAKKIWCDYFNIPAHGIIFTSGGTESNYLLIKTLLFQQRQNEAVHIIATTVEHASLYETLKILKRRSDISVTFLQPETNGKISRNQLVHALKPTTKLITIQTTNSETGIQQDIKMIGAFAQEHKLFFHTDAVQAFGKCNLAHIFDHADAVSISAHKIHGVKGIGALLIKHPENLAKPFYAGSQFGFKQGTIDPALIASFAVATDDYISHEKTRLDQLKMCRRYFIEQLQAAQLPLTIINRENEQSHIIACLCDNVSGDLIQQALNRQQIYVSTKSACQSHSSGPLRSLAPLFGDNQHHHFLRISCGYFTSLEDLDQVIKLLTKHLRK